jgi:hypothetical protein
VTRFARILFPAFLFALLYASVAASAADDPAAADAQWFKSAKGMQAQLHLTGKPEEFVRAWRGGEDYRGLLLEPDQRVEPGAHVATVLMLSGCHPGPAGCNVLVDYQLVGPNGARIDGTRGQHAWQGAARPGSVHLSEAMVRFTVPPKGPPGEYRVVATVREPSSDIVLELRRSFHVAAHP